MIAIPFVDKPRFFFLVGVWVFAAVAWCGVNVASAQPAQPVGELVLAKGMVKIRALSGREAVFRDIGQRIPVRMGDVIQSGRDSRANIFFREEREKISLYSNTNFQVTELTPKRSSFGLSIGKAFFAALAGVRNNSFNVRTTTATIGIKGTKFVASTDGLETFLLTTEGVVGFSNLDFPNIEVKVGANQASSVRFNQQPSPPQEITPDQVRGVLEQEGSAPFENIGLPQGEPLGPQPSPGDGTGAVDPAGEAAAVTEAVIGNVVEVQPSMDTTTRPVDISVTR